VNLPYMKVWFSTLVLKLNFHARFSRVHVISYQSQGDMWHFFMINDWIFSESDLHVGDMIFVFRTNWFARCCGLLFFLLQIVYLVNYLCAKWMVKRIYYYVSMESKLFWKTKFLLWYQFFRRRRNLIYNCLCNGATNN